MADAIPLTVDVDEILEKNPNVDKKLLEEAKRLHEELLKTGTLKGGYRLAPPYSGRHIRVGEQSGDPRTRHLAKRSVRG